VSATEEGLGSRLELADPDSLNGAQRDLFDHVIANAVPWAQRSGFAATTAHGRLIGPFNPSLLNPQIGTAFLTLQAAEEHNTSLDERVRQVVILTVGAVWQARYELYAHSTVARRGGLSDAVVTELAAGTMPDGLTEQEQTAHRLTRALSTSHHVDDDLYRDAKQTLGAADVFELAVLAGIYHTVCGILNVFDIPAP
jgi:4-carboxymuconolactone decarboxylase